MLNFLFKREGFGYINDKSIDWNVEMISVGEDGNKKTMKEKRRN